MIAHRLFQLYKPQGDGPAKLQYISVSNIFDFPQYAGRLFSSSAREAREGMTGIGKSPHPAHSPIHLSANSIKLESDGNRTTCFHLFRRAGRWISAQVKQRRSIGPNSADS